MKQHPSDIASEVSPIDVGTLTDHQLLQVLLGERAPPLESLGTLGDLSRASLPEIMARGVPEADALILLATFELGRRSRRGGPLPQTLHAPEDAYELLLPQLEDSEREKFLVVVLDVRNRPRHVAQVALGSVDHCIVDPRDVFAPAIREHGTAVLIAHNHPSGDPTPSREDVELTQRLVHAGELIGMPVLDHMIIATGPLVGARKFVSLAEVGVMLGGRIVRPRKKRKESVSEGASSRPLRRAGKRGARKKKT
jgi:DNA repair protein RadC